MDSSGPHIGAAVICERVLTEQDGVLSAIRIVDRVVFVTGDDGQPLATQHPVNFFISLKSDQARGSFNLQIRREGPSGQDSLIVEVPVHLEGEERGANLVIAGAFEPEEAGLYWFDVILEGTRLTRMPLRAVYQSPMRTG